MYFLLFFYWNRVPDGASESDNLIVRSWGADSRKLSNSDGAYQWHDDIAKGLNGMDMPAAAKLSGSRFSVLIGDVAKLERAIGQYFLDFHAARGYTEVSVPHIVLRSCLEGTGQLPKFEEDLFKVNHTVGEEEGKKPLYESPGLSSSASVVLSSI
jgi:seryl-tRNA synthetase